jgi:hypothetical protein
MDDGDALTLIFYAFTCSYLRWERPSVIAANLAGNSASDIKKVERIMLDSR